MSGFESWRGYQAMKKGFIAVGANLGERLQNLRQALRAFEQSPSTQVVRCSSIYESSAHTVPGEPEQPDYLNAVWEVATSLSPEELLSFCHAVEQRAGRQRQRTRQWAARALDLDLLALGTHEANGPALTLPHPRLASRRFVLLPWADLSPDHVVGGPFAASVSELLAQCPDQGRVRRTALDW